MSMVPFMTNLKLLLDFVCFSSVSPVGLVKISSFGNLIMAVDMVLS